MVRSSKLHSVEAITALVIVWKNKHYLWRKPVPLPAAFPSPLGVAPREGCFHNIPPFGLNTRRHPLDPSSEKNIKNLTECRVFWLRGRLLNLWTVVCATMVKIREYWMIYIYRTWVSHRCMIWLLPHPPSPTVSKFFIFVSLNECRGSSLLPLERVWGEGGAKSYDGEKAWLSIKGFNTLWSRLLKYFVLNAWWYDATLFFI